MKDEPELCCTAAKQTYDNPREDGYRTEDPLHELEEADKKVGIESIEAG